MTAVTAAESKPFQAESDGVVYVTDRGLLCRAHPQSGATRGERRGERPPAAASTKHMQARPHHPQHAHEPRGRGHRAEGAESEAESDGERERECAVSAFLLADLIAASDSASCLTSHPIMPYTSRFCRKKRGRELQTLRVAFTASAVRAAERSFLVSVSVGVGTEELAVLLAGGLERKPCHEEAAYA